MAEKLCRLASCDEPHAGYGYCDAHLRERNPAAWARRNKLLGRTEPRLYTPPLRQLTRATSRGYEVADFADQILGEPLLPWQRWAVVHGLELAPGGGFRFRVVLILVARQNGKTHVLKVVSLWRLFLDMARLVLGVAQDLSIARESWQACIDTIKSSTELSEELDVVRNTNGDEYFRTTAGGRYKIGAASRSAGRGLSVDQLNMDELREQRSWAAWSALSKTTMARPDGQTWAFSNMGDAESVVLNHLREAALSGRDPSIFIAEWSGEEDCELDDREAIAQANPALGYTITEQAITSARATDPPAVYRTEVLCQRVDALETAIDMSAWRAGADPAGTLDGVRDRVVVCLDVAPDGEHVTLAAAAEVQQLPSLSPLYRVEIVAAWPRTSAARAELGDMLQRIAPRAVAWFPGGPAAALAGLLKGSTFAQRLSEDDPVLQIKGAQVAEACQNLADLVKAGSILHPDDPLLNAHIGGASTLHQGDGWRFIRRGAGHCDAAYAAAGAIYAAATVPIAKPLPRSAIY